MNGHTHSQCTMYVQTCTHTHVTTQADQRGSDVREDEGFSSTGRRQSGIQPHCTLNLLPKCIPTCTCMYVHAHSFMELHVRIYIRGINCSSNPVKIPCDLCWSLNSYLKPWQNCNDHAQHHTGIHTSSQIKTYMYMYMEFHLYTRTYSQKQLKKGEKENTCTCMPHSTHICKCIRTHVFCMYMYIHYMYMYIHVLLYTTHQTRPP